MAIELALNGPPQTTTLDPDVGNVLHVTVPVGTTFLVMSSPSVFFLDFSSAADGAAGDPAAQFRYRAGTVRDTIPETTTEVIYRVVGSVADQSFSILARGPEDSDVVGVAAAAARARLGAQILRFLPADYVSAVDLLGGPVGALALVRGTAALILNLVTVGRGTGIWLTLHGRGLGVNRTADESDPELRRRIREVADAVTRPALLNAVNALLSSVTITDATMTEWFEGSALDNNFHLDNEDQAVFAGGPQSFVITAPRLGGTFTEAIYFSIIASVETNRAGGTQWRLRIPSA